MEKIVENKQKRGLHNIQKSDEVKQYSIPGADNMRTYSQKQNRHMFVVDWQLNNESKTSSK